jgi:hypothetical protein
MSTNLSSRHLDTLEKVLNHESSGNVEWRAVLALLRSAGTVVERDNGKVQVTLGPETETFRAPHGKDIDEQTLADLRRMLTQAGLGATPPSRDTRTRDHGDGQWGEPG